MIQLTSPDSSVREFAKEVLTLTANASHRLHEACMKLSQTRGWPLLLIAISSATMHAGELPPDLLIVGGGITGLAAAAEGAHLGLRVTVVDRNSVYGGTAVNAYGVTIVDSPLQRKLGIKDSESLATSDFVSWGGDPEPNWVEIYVKHSKAELYDWFAERGVIFERLVMTRGSSVARFHFPVGGVIGMVQALYREIHRIGGVKFVMHSDVTSLMLEKAHVVGVNVRDYRSGLNQTIRARNVLLSTGGFQNNEELVRKFWPSQSRSPEQILLGSGLESTGSGLDLAREVGAAITRMDRQWNYVPGIRLPKEYGYGRGVYLDFPGPIWVNQNGKRFINEGADKSVRLDALIRQEHSSGWMIFDSTLMPALVLVHPIFNQERTKGALLGRPNMLKQGNSLEELATKAGLPVAAMLETVARYNAGFISGHDELGRRLPAEPNDQSTTKPINAPPFFALQIFPITRKSMGGIQVDSNCRVIADTGKEIPNLYAAGEATGFGGVNGKQSLEGTFVGTGILMGRIAARAIAGEEQTNSRSVPGTSFLLPSAITGQNSQLDANCIACHNLSALTQSPRPGFRHFESSHRIVLERSYSCQECHGEMAPYRPDKHTIDQIAQARSCTVCHSRVH